MIAAFAMLLPVAPSAAGQVSASIAPPPAPINFQAISTSEVFVLGVDGSLWLDEAPWGAVPPAQTQVDANVKSFQALSDSEVLVLGTDGNLWLEYSSRGAPSRRIACK